MGMLITWAWAAFQPSSVKMVGMKDDIEAAVMSQQKNMMVLRPVSTWSKRD
jgi:hypothetical protein